MTLRASWPSKWPQNERPADVETLRAPIAPTRDSGPSARDHGLDDAHTGRPFGAMLLEAAQLGAFGDDVES